MKKVVKLLCGAVFLLCICWFIGQQLKTARLNQEEQANSGWNLVDYIDTPAVVLNGRTESADYPYGYNLGAIEDDEVGRAVFLTAGTAIEIEGKVAEGTVLDVNYEIHPWVASESDGALLNIAIISGDVKQDLCIQLMEMCRGRRFRWNSFLTVRCILRCRCQMRKGKTKIVTGWY